MSTHDSYSNSLPKSFIVPENDPTEQPFFTSEPDGVPQDDDETHEALYAILNLSKECTQEEIQKSYKRLAALLHPDRHLKPELKSAADHRFSQLQHAFEILSDPQQRMIYDELGTEGLKTNWQVGNKYKSSAELRAEFERIGRKQLEADVESLIRSKGELTCITDARVLFLSDQERRELGGPEEMSWMQKIQTVQTRQLFLKHSFVNPITPSTTVLLTSQLLARSGTGAGNVLGKILYNPSSRVSLEIGTTLLRPRNLPFKATYTPDVDTFITLNSTLKTFASPPNFSLTLGRRIFEQTTGIFTIRSGQYSIFSWGRSDLEPISSSSLTFGLQNNSGWGVDLSTGLLGSSLSGQYSKVVLGGVKVAIGGAVTVQGLMSVFLSGDRRVTENVRAGMTLDLGQNGVMTLKLRLNRLGQRLNFPVIISSNWNPALALSFTVVPVVGIIAANHLVINPRKKKRLGSKINELRKEHAEMIKEKRKEAEEAIALLAEHVKRKIEEEERIQGLIIEEAYYGAPSSFPSPTRSNFSQDPDPDPHYQSVAIPLQALVSHSQLIIPSGRSKSHLLGFYDPAMGEKKALKVRYRFRGKVHQCQVGELEALALPLRGHALED